MPEASDALLWEREMNPKKLESTLNEILSNYDAGEVIGVSVSSDKTSVRITIETLSRNDVIEVKNEDDDRNSVHGQD